MIAEHHVNVTISASYATLNEFTADTERVWLVFHGYGMLARFFIKKFERLNPDKNFIIAPQGLSKYYQEGFNGRVGATWMTKEDRLTEIDNQFSYIDRVLQQYDLTGKALVYFGFSQGVATMGRFSARARRAFSKMILWAGTFPPDIERGSFDFMTGDEELLSFVSKEDPFLEHLDTKAQEDILSGHFGKLPELAWYEGGHVAKQEIIATL